MGCLTDRIAAEITIGSRVIPVAAIAFLDPQRTAGHWIAVAIRARFTARSGRTLAGKFSAESAERQSPAVSHFNRDRLTAAVAATLGKRIGCR